MVEQLLKPMVTHIEENCMYTVMDTLGSKTNGEGYILSIWWRL